MKTSKIVSKKVGRLPKGYVFTYTRILEEVKQKEAVIKALNRMVESGKLAKLSKGRFYKPENSSFGSLQPNQAQVVKDLLEEKGKVTGYLTGYSIYNQLGLTTQISNTIQIGKNQIRPAFNRGRYRISCINQKNTITRENIPYLQVLDAFRYIKKIPDTSVETSCRRLLAIINSYTGNEITTLVRLALKYPPAVRALLGAFLDQLQKGDSVGPLLESLNPITKYRLPGVGKAISTTGKWNIL